MIKDRILVCDDEEGVRESLKLILSEKYDIIFAKNGDEALQKIRSQDKIRLLILDIKMPKRNGLDLLKDIRLHSNIPVVIVTGYHSVEACNKAIKHGASDYIVKPFDSESVLEAVNKALS